MNKENRQCILPDPTPDKKPINKPVPFLQRNKTMAIVVGVSILLCCLLLIIICCLRILKKRRASTNLDFKYKTYSEEENLFDRESGKIN